MRDLYEILEVPRNATQAEIKKSYRRLSKEKHPDKEGGSEAAMSELSEAYEVLSNPDRRQRYDETGQTKKGPNKEEEYASFALNFINKIFEGELEEESFDPRYDNAVSFLKKYVKEALKEGRKIRKQNTKKIERLEEMLKRTKKGKRNFFVMFLEARHSAGLKMQENLEREMELYEKLKEEIFEYEYETDEIPEGFQRPEKKGGGLFERLMENMGRGNGPFGG